MANPEAVEDLLETQVKIIQGKHSMEETRNAEVCMERLFSEAGLKAKDPFEVSMGTRVRARSTTPTYRIAKITDKGSIKIVMKSDSDNNSVREYFVFAQHGYRVEEMMIMLYEAEKRLLGDEWKPARRMRFAKNVFKNEWLRNKIIEEVRSNSKGSKLVKSYFEELVEKYDIDLNYRFIVKYLEKEGVIIKSGKAYTPIIPKPAKVETPPVEEPVIEEAKEEKKDSQFVSIMLAGIRRMEVEAKQYEEIEAQIDELTKAIDDLDQQRMALEAQSLKYRKSREYLDTMADLMKECLKPDECPEKEPEE